MRPSASLPGKYDRLLRLVRQDPCLLEDYRFKSSTSDSRHFERLRLNIAMYNDFKETDFEIARFLFEEEMKWRQHPSDGEVDNLYFSAFLLALHHRPEVLSLFLDTKETDFDSSIGFDAEFFVAAGIEETYDYLETLESDRKQRIFDYIGEAKHTCQFTQQEIDDWVSSKHDYFNCYHYPIADEIWFLYSTNERDLFLELLPEWIRQERDWTRQELSLFEHYAAYSGDSGLQIQAAEWMVEKKDSHPFMLDTEKNKLAALYITEGAQEKALMLLTTVTNESDNDNIIRDSIAELCRMISINQDPGHPLSLRALDIIRRYQRRYGKFSPHVDGLVDEAFRIMRTEKPVFREGFFSRLFKF